MRQKPKQIPFYPVAAYTVGSLPDMDAITIQFDFLTYKNQSLQDADKGRHYLLSETRARELIVDLQMQLAALSSQQPPTTLQ